MKHLWLAPFACALSLATTPSQPLIAQEVSSTNQPGQADDEAATYIVFDAPCGGSGSVHINAAGTVVGSCYTGDLFQGFYRLADGTIRTFNVPGADTEGDATSPTAINSSGIIIGSYVKASGDIGGFLLDRLGNYTEFDPPDSHDTEPAAINAAGTVTGWYVNSGNVVQGFIRDAEGNITSFSDPHGFQTYPTAINSLGNITGFAEDVQGAVGFLRESNGKFKVIAPADLTGVVPVLITDGGKIVGPGLNGSINEGFIRDPEGNYTTFIPGVGAGDLILTGIDRNQPIVGYYYDLEGINTVAFYRLQDGRITSFTPIGVGAEPRNPAATAISPEGDIAGFFSDSLGVHCFIRVNPNKPATSAVQYKDTSVEPSR
jgi:hypothetical protein